MPHILAHMTDTTPLRIVPLTREAVKAAAAEITTIPDAERAAELAAAPDGVLDFTFIVEHCGLSTTKALLLLVDRYGLERVMLWHRNTCAAMGRTDL